MCMPRSKLPHPLSTKKKKKKKKKPDCLSWFRASLFLCCSAVKVYISHRQKKSRRSLFLLSHRPTLLSSSVFHLYTGHLAWRARWSSPRGRACYHNTAKRQHSATARHAVFATFNPYPHLLFSLFHVCMKMRFDYDNAFLTEVLERKKYWWFKAGIFVYVFIPFAFTLFGYPHTWRSINDVADKKHHLDNTTFLFHLPCARAHRIQYLTLNTPHIRHVMICAFHHHGGGGRHNVVLVWPFPRTFMLWYYAADIAGPIGARLSQCLNNALFCLRPSLSFFLSPLAHCPNHFLATKPMKPCNKPIDINRHFVVCWDTAMCYDYAEKAGCFPPGSQQRLWYERDMTNHEPLVQYVVWTRQFARLLTKHLNA